MSNVRDLFRATNEELHDVLVRRVAAMEPSLRINARDTVCLFCGCKNSHDNCAWLMAHALLEQMEKP